MAAYSKEKVAAIVVNVFNRMLTKCVINKTIVVMSTIADTKVAHNYNWHNGHFFGSLRRKRHMMNCCNCYRTNGKGNDYI